MLITSKTIHNHLNKAQKIILVPHQNPDGDALGSVGALAEYLLNYLKKEVSIFCATTIPQNLTFIPHTHLIQNDEELFNSKNIDTILVVDSGDLQYAGIHKFVKNHSATIINIDHHPTNKNYGHINLLNSEASSTTEIIYDFLKINRVSINPKIATALLTGIITDTGNFTNSATTFSALNISGKLLRCGANIGQINKHTLKNNSLSILKLWGILLNRLEYHTQKEMVYTYLTQEDYKKYKLDEKEVDGMANFMNIIGGVKVALFLKETEKGEIKGSFRTTHDDVDVSVLAKKFNGGGHKKAAGFTVEGNMETVLSQILTMN